MFEYFIKETINLPTHCSLSESHCVYGQQPKGELKHRY